MTRRIPEIPLTTAPAHMAIWAPPIIRLTKRRKYHMPAVMRKMAKIIAPLDTGWTAAASSSSSRSSVW